MHLPLRPLISGLSALSLLAAWVPARAASLTWGYDYARDRATSAPIAGLDVQPNYLGTEIDSTPPFVVPLPGQSQSTPIIGADGRWYHFTYWDGGQSGTLWTGVKPDGAPGTAGSAVLPLSAEYEESFAEPADAAISPDGRWVVFAAGMRAWSWPAGDPADAVVEGLSGPGPDSAVSVSPTIIPDPQAASGWAFCVGNWNGSEYCYPVLSAQQLADQTAPPTYTVYYSTFSDNNADAGWGTAPITSSAAYDASTGDVYFGVASWDHPRVVAMNALTGDYSQLGLGQVAAPVWASAAVSADGGSVYASDTYGDLYRFDAASGALLAWTRAGDCGGAEDIDSPGVYGGSVYFVGCGYRRLMQFDAGSLAMVWGPSVDWGLGQSSDITVVSGDPGPQVVFTSTLGSIEDVLPPATGPSWATAGPASSSFFSSAVVDNTMVLDWNDGATAFWSGTPSIPSTIAPPPGGYSTSGTPGGIEFFSTAPRLTAFVSEYTVTAGTNQQPVYLNIMATPGASVAVAGGSWPQAQAGPADAPASTACATSSGWANYGFFYSRSIPQQGSTPPRDCGPWATQYDQLQSYFAQVGWMAHPQHPGWAGPQVSEWADSGFGYTAFSIPLTVPQKAGWYDEVVTAALPDGAATTGTVWVQAVCPSGDATLSDGTCQAPPPPQYCPAASPNHDELIPSYDNTPQAAANFCDYVPPMYSTPGPGGFPPLQIPMWECQDKQIRPDGCNAPVLTK